ncbi:MAG TPA: radical SAM protein [Polyangia bacterium]|nr:radical SAM protein [Polyangia bacterium]
MASLEDCRSRERWPFPALLPHSLKIYPIVQTAERIGPQPIAAWPPPMAPEVAAWRDATSFAESTGNQIYLHVPFCPFLCHFCPLFKVTKAKDRTEERQEEFVSALIDEIELYGGTPSVAAKSFNSVYFGGGTPTQLTPLQLTRILTALRRNLTITADAEITLEGVAKQMLAPGYLEPCFTAGFNRVSFGVQSLNARQRQLIGRGDRVDDYPALVTLVRSLNPAASANCEIMAGLPDQTFDALESDLRELVSWKMNSVDVLYYVQMAGTRLAQLVTKKKRSEPEFGARLLRMRQFTNNFFREAGYQQVTGEVFVRNERDLFVHTSFGGGGNCLNTLLALGPSGFGHISGTVYHNVCDLDAYCSSIRERRFPIGTAQSMDGAAARRRAFILSLLRLQLPEFAIGSWRERKLVDDWTRFGLLSRVPGGYRLTERGTLWYNHMQIEALPMTEMLRILRMFGSIDDQEASLRDDNSQTRELLELVRARGGVGHLGEMVYRGILKAHKLPIFDRRAIGFTGPVSA